MRNSWGAAWADRSFRSALLTGGTFLIMIAFLLPRFFAFIEKRPGIGLYDPLLAAVGPIDVSTITFGILYPLILAGVIALLRSPYRFVRMLHAYVILLLSRMITMYLITLEPPLTIIPLIDPITQNFYPADEPFLKDLFFSGHTATSVLFALAVRPGRLRMILAVGALIVASLVLVQHVHYTVDVLAAPFFATLAWALAGALLDLFNVKGADRTGYFDRFGSRFR